MEKFKFREDLFFDSFCHWIDKTFFVEKKTMLTGIDTSIKTEENLIDVINLLMNLHFWVLWKKQYGFGIVIPYSIRKTSNYHASWLRYDFSDEQFKQSNLYIGPKTTQETRVISKCQGSKSNVILRRIFFFNSYLNEIEQKKLINYFLIQKAITGNIVFLNDEDYKKTVSVHESWSGETKAVWFYSSVIDLRGIHSNKNAELLLNTIESWNESINSTFIRDTIDLDNFEKGFGRFELKHDLSYFKTDYDLLLHMYFQMFNADITVETDDQDHWGEVTKIVFK